MITIRLLLLLSLSTLSVIDSEMNAQNFPTNELGQRDGECSYFDDTQGTWFVVNFSNGELHGVYKEFSLWKSRKTLRYYALYNNGKLDGMVRTYRYDGKLEKEESYINGALNGPSKWYNRGKLIREEFYKSGLPHGEWRFYDRNEKFSSHFFCSDGDCGNTFFYDGKGNLTREIVRGGNGLGYKDIYYDEKGKIIKTRLRPEGIPPND